MTQGFSGVGLVSIHNRLSGGLKGTGFHLGNCPKLDIQFTPNSNERNSSMDPTRPSFRRMTQSTQGQVTLVCDEFNKKNLVTFLLGRIDEVAADAATTINYTFPTGALVGDVLAVQQMNITNQVITDSSGSPKTLVPGVNYDPDAFAGHAKLLDLTTGGPYVQPFKSAHKQGAVSVIAGLAAPQPEVWLSMAGTNADNNARGMLDAYRVRLDVTKAMSFINEGYQDFELTGSVLQDTTKVASAVGGQFYKFGLPSTHE